MAKKAYSPDPKAETIKPLTERIDAFDEFLHRKPGKQANPSK